MELQLRAYRSGDAPVIAGWIRTEEELYRWSADRICIFPLSGQDIDRHYKQVMEGGRFFPMTAVDGGGNVAGHFILRYPLQDDSSLVRFGFVIVNPALRGQGFGKEMLRLGIDYARNTMKAARMDLGVFSDNDAARYCYEAAGFREKGRYACTLPVGERECIEMEYMPESREGNM